MADTHRLANLVEETAKSQSKLVLVGDQAQLSAIGAGGMFSAIQEQVPTAELTEVHVASNVGNARRGSRSAREVRERAREYAGARAAAHHRHPRAGRRGDGQAMGRARTRARRSAR